MSVARDIFSVWGNSIGRIRLSVSTVNRTYELSGITHVTPFRKYGKHSTGPSTYGPWVRAYSKLFSRKSVLTVCSYRAQSNEICTYGRVSRGSLPRVRRYGQSNTTINSHLPHLSHYSDVTWAIHFRSPANWLFLKQQVNNTENIISTLLP